MKYFLFILILTLSISCSIRPTVLADSSASIKIHDPYHPSYTDSLTIVLATDGHDYLAQKTTSGYVIYTHSVECRLCASKSNNKSSYVAGGSVLIKHDTVYVAKKEPEKGIKLLCIGAGSIIQQGRIHDAVSDLKEGQYYISLTKAFKDPEEGDSVYYIEGVGTKLVNRFVIPLR